jgi:hypothetical protein
MASRLPLHTVYAELVDRCAADALIVSHRRREGVAKIDKDVTQAALLLDILAERRKADDLRDAWAALQGRGPKWRRLAGEGLEALPAETLDRLRGVVAASAG